MCFHEILYCGLLLKSVEKVKVSSLSEKVDSISTTGDEDKNTKSSNI